MMHLQIIMFRIIVLLKGKKRDAISQHLKVPQYEMETHC